MRKRSVTPLAVGRPLLDPSCCCCCATAREHTVTVTAVLHRLAQRTHWSIGRLQSETKNSAINISPFDCYFTTTLLRLHCNTDDPTSRKLCVSIEYFLTLNNFADYSTHRNYFLVPSFSNLSGPWANMYAFIYYLLFFLTGINPDEDLPTEIPVKELYVRAPPRLIRSAYWVIFVDLVLTAVVWFWAEDWNSGDFWEHQV